MILSRDWSGWLRMWKLIGANYVTYGPPWSTIWNRSDWA